MEVKLSHRATSFPALRNAQTPCSRWGLGNGRSFRKHFMLFAKGWRFPVKMKFEAQSFLWQDLCDVVKGRETLTSISKQYGVSIRSIKIADRNLLDIDPVFRGHLLDIPATSSSDTQMVSKEKHFVTLSSHGLPHVHLAQSTGYYLVLVPLVALCISCIVAVFHTRVTKDSTRQGLSESSNHQHGTRSMRWRHALSDTGDPDQMDSDSSQENNGTSPDDYKNAFEAVPARDYGKLEHDYQKFLGECGISNYGYWRGGSPQ